MYISIKIYTRVLGPPKAGRNNKRETLIEMNVLLLEDILLLEKLKFLKYHLMCWLCFAL